jgi:hypothetical protein
MTSQAWRDAFSALLQISQNMLAAAESADPDALDALVRDRTAAWRCIDRLATAAGREPPDAETLAFLTETAARIRETDQAARAALTARRHALMAQSETARRLSAEGFLPHSYFTATAVNVRA